VNRDIAKVESEAAAWLARLRADNRTDADEVAFNAWVSESPAHAKAFESALAIWEVLGSVPREMKDRESRPAFMRRREVLAGLLVATGSVVTVSFWSRAEAKVYQTAVGEQRRIVLDDGSIALLDTDTRVVVNFDTKKRMVTLERGRANIHVAIDPKRPFILSDPDETIVADASEFEVRRRIDGLSIVVIDGHASLAEGTARTMVGSGQRLVISGKGTRVDRPSMRPLLAWRSGQAILENEKLADAITEMNRYSEVKLTIGDAAVGSMRISGVYKVGDNDRFARAVSHLLPVKIQHSGDKLILTMDIKRLRQG
jgi:transmembrane sensor